MEDILKDHVSVKLAAQLSFCGLSNPEDSKEAATVFAVADDPVTVQDSLRHASEQLETTSGQPPEIIVIDSATNALLEKLAAAGLLSINRDAMNTLFESECFRQPARRESLRKRKLVEPLLADAAKQHRLANVLMADGFPDEAAKPLKAAIQTTGCILYTLAVETTPSAPPDELTADMVRLVSLLPEWPEEFTALFNESLAPDPVLNEDALVQVDRMLAEANRQTTVLAMTP